jgi:hypothetical protein
MLYSKDEEIDANYFPKCDVLSAEEDVIKKYWDARQKITH